MSSKIVLMSRAEGFGENQAHRPDCAPLMQYFLAALMFGMVFLAHAETVQLEAQKKPQVGLADIPIPQEGHSKRPLSPDETRVEVQLPETGIQVLKGKIRGYKATVFALRVRHGQNLKVSFESPSDSAFFNVVDESDSSGQALFVGQNTTARSITMPIGADGTYLLQPYLVRSVARRGKQVDFLMKIDLR